MFLKVLESWSLLLYFESLMRFRGFEAIHRVVSRKQVRERHGTHGSSEAICQAVDIACVLYFKRVLCLQRSAATTLLLRRHGWPATMVIGAQLLPFESHAWVEIDGCVVNDKPYIREMYQELERC
ncbi:lasso peptide biosynthesis B2 protein [Silvibacterium sp.]|uniref:lasso peptide biosynthesis B2 protein n=1 Tax=Silvibacterium sp. TaxID=1964179 RepID=UPI0039E65AD4